MAATKSHSQGGIRNLFPEWCRDFRSVERTCRWFRSPEMRHNRRQMRLLCYARGTRMKFLDARCRRGGVGAALAAGLAVMRRDRRRGGRGDFRPALRGRRRYHRFRRIPGPPLRHRRARTRPDLPHPRPERPHRRLGHPDTAPPRRPRQGHLLSRRHSPRHPCRGQVPYGERFPISAAPWSRPASPGTSDAAATASTRTTRRRRARPASAFGPGATPARRHGTGADGKGQTGRLHS